MSNTVFFGQGENPDENFKEKTLCVFLLDTSGSMYGPKIDHLNDGLKTFYQDILAENALAEGLEVSIVTFDSYVKNLQPPALAADFTMPTLNASGGTDMVGGIKKAIEIVKERKDYYKGQNITYKRPWIVMITDGQANVDSIKDQVKKDGDAKHYFFLPIAADNGPDIDMKLLNSLATDRAYQLKGLKFSDFFQWLSRSFDGIVQAKPGDKVDVTPSPELLSAYEC